MKGHWWYYIRIIIIMDYSRSCLSKSYRFSYYHGIIYRGYYTSLYIIAILFKFLFFYIDNINDNIFYLFVLNP